MKPSSLKLFDILFLAAALLVLVSAMLSFASLEARVVIGIGAEGENAQNMAIWVVIASIFIFLLLATIVWASISLMRIGFMRWALALVVLYALYQSVHALMMLGMHLAGIVDLAANLVALAAVAVLFRADARAWFSEKPGDRAAL